MSLTRIVTGANGGLGLEFVRQFRAQGDHVIATVREGTDASELEALGAEVARVDVTRQQDADGLVRHLAGRPIDVLVNNAGLGGQGDPLEGLDPASLLPFLEVNAVGTLRMTLALLPLLRAGRRKLVVNVTSRMGSIADNSSGGYHGYRASKAALNMLHRGLALSLREDGFAMLLVHPGWVRTAMGGAGAPLSPPESVKGMIALMDRWTPGQSDRFVDHSGAAIPW